MIKIYGIFHLNNLIYVGQTSRTLKVRFQNHKARLQGERRSKLISKMKKYPLDQFRIILIEECSEAESDAREVYWISKYNLTNLGCNHAVGGKVNRGFTISDERKKSISDMKKANNHFHQYNGSIEQKNMLSEKMSNRDITWGDKISKAKGSDYTIRIDNVSFNSWSLSKTARDFGLSSASLKRSAKLGITVKSKGRTVSCVKN